MPKEKQKSMAYTFVLSDESVNSYGFRVLTAGIDTERFENNPVMFYRHDQERGVIGRWENLRKEDSKLLADAVFDESTPLGTEVKNRVENGFLRSVSIGLSDDITPEMIDGINTVTRCVLYEASICDIPSNKNAVRLYDKKGLIVLNIKDLNGFKGDLKERLLKLLSLKATATDDQIIQAVAEKINTPEKEIEQALEMGYADKSDLILMRALAKSDGATFRQFIQEKKDSQPEEIDKAIDNAVSSGKIVAFEKQLFKDIGKSLGITRLKAVLNIFPSKMSFSEMLENGGVGDSSKWTLADYRKYAPHKLKDNPKLYAQLLGRENDNSLPETSLDLDHYRKNDPDYLLKNPGEYERLIKHKNNNNN